MELTTCKLLFSKTLQTRIPKPKRESAKIPSKENVKYNGLRTIMYIDLNINALRESARNNRIVNIASCCQITGDRTKGLNNTAYHLPAQMKMLGRKTSRCENT